MENKERNDSWTLWTEEHSKDKALIWASARTWSSATRYKFGIQEEAKDTEGKMITKLCEMTEETEGKAIAKQDEITEDKEEQTATKDKSTKGKEEKTATKDNAPNLQASDEMLEKHRHNHNDAKAVKSNDAEVPVHIWDEAVCHEQPSERELGALKTLRDFCLRLYRRKLWIKARAYLIKTHGRDWTGKLLRGKHMWLKMWKLYNSSYGVLRATIGLNTHTGQAYFSFAFPRGTKHKPNGVCG